MHIGNTEIFYFIIEQPTPEPDIRIYVEYKKKINGNYAVSHGQNIEQN